MTMRKEPNSFTISTGAVTSTSIVINWNEATTTGPPIVQYIIYITNVVTDVEENRVVPPTDDRTYTYTITGLLPATRYEILTEAEADEGSTFSNFLEVTTAPNNSAPTNDDAPVASISASPTIIAEGTAATFRVTLGSAAPAGGLTISVAVTESGSYIAGSAPATVFIAEGTTTVTLEVSTDDDDTGEPTGSITATITVPDDAGYTVAAAPENAAVVAVLDNDAPVASIIPDPTPITEGADAIFTVTLDRAAPAGGLTINVALTESGSYIDGSILTMDLIAAGLQTSIVAGTTTTALRIPTVDDSMIEPTGSITVRITTGVGYTVGTPRTAMVTVLDNDTPVASITESTSRITEGADAVFTVTLDRAAPAGGVTISVTVTESGSYIAGPAPATVLFIAEGETTGTLTVPTEDDSLDETDGNISVRINAGTDYALGLLNATAVIVEDNDILLARITADSTPITEGTAATFRVTLGSAAPAGGLTISVTVTESGSYISSGLGRRTVFIDAGATTSTLTVSTDDDGVIEEAGTITAELNAGIGYTVGNAPDHQAAVTVLDNDAPVASISVAPTTITEGAVTVITVTLDRPATTFTTINVDVTESGSYISSGLGQRSVFFFRDDTTAVTTINTEDDTTDEPDGTITFRLATGTGYTVGTLSTAMATVNDNDEPVVSITAAGPTPITEGTAATFRVALDQVALAGGLTISVEVTESGSYIDETAPATVFIAEGTTTVTLEVSTDDDGTIEETGTITVRITTGADYTVGDAPDHQAAVTVFDDDTPVVSISVAPTTITEGDITTITLTFDRTVAARTVISLEVTESGSYIFGAASATVFIDGGRMSGSANIITNTDTTDEPDGIITVRINTGAGYTVGTTSTAIVTVLDDDLLAASISADPSPITEGTPTTFTVTLSSAAPAGGITVSVEVTESGSYIASSAPETVFIAASATSGTLTVPTDDDNRDEPTGSITAEINIGTGYTVGTMSTAMVTVNNDDVLLASITAEDPTTITEGLPATFKVTLDLAAPAGGVTIRVEVTESGRYIASSAPMTVDIAAGATSGTLTVLIDDENRDELAGIITAAITTGTGYTVGSPDQAMVMVAADVIPLSVVVTNGDAMVVDGSTVTVAVGTTLRLTVVGTGQDGAGTTAMLSRVATQLPDLIADSATDSSLTRLFVWAPAASDRGTHRIEFAATLGSESTSISIDVRVAILPPPPEIGAVVHQPADGLFVAVHRRGPGGLQIRWVHNDAAVGTPPILGYRVYWYKVSDGHESAQMSDLIPPAADGTAQRYTVNGLEGAVEYVVTVVAVNSDGQSAFPRVVPGPTSVTEACPTCLPYNRGQTGERVFFNSPLPGVNQAVDNLRAVSNEAGEIFVSWDQPSIFVSIPLNRFGRYEVNWGIGTDFRTFAVPVCAGDIALDACPNTYTITGLQHGQVYNVRVGALIRFGSETLVETFNFVDDVPVLAGVGVTADAVTGVVEGEAVPFRVTLGGALIVPVTVDWAASGSAINAGPEPSGSVTIDAGKLSVAISVQVPDDSLDEDDQTLTVTISAPADGLANGAKITTTTALATVLDNDTLLVSITADSTPITEGSAAAFTVTLDQVAPAGGVMVSVDVTGSGSYIEDPAPTEVFVTSGATTAMLTVPTDDDNLDEPNGVVTVTIDPGTGYTVGVPSTAMVTVLDDDVLLASITAADPTTITEGEVATFTVTLARAAPAGGLTINVDVTQSGSYIDVAAPTEVVIAEGATTGTLAVSTEDDSMDETDGSITAVINAGTGYTVADAPDNAAVVTVLDDEAPVVSISAGPSPIIEGTTATFMVTLSSEAPADGLTISVGVTESGSYIDGSTLAPAQIEAGLQTFIAPGSDDRYTEYLNRG